MNIAVVMICEHSWKEQTYELATILSSNYFRAHIALWQATKRPIRVTTKAPFRSTTPSQDYRVNFQYICPETNTTMYSTVHLHLTGGIAYDSQYRQTQHHHH